MTRTLLAVAAMAAALTAAILATPAHGQPAPAVDKASTPAPRRERPPIVVAPDRRIPIVLSPEARSRVLADMRLYLSGIQAVFAAASQQDTAGVARAARNLAAPSMHDVSLVSPSPFEGEFRELGARLRHDLTRIADDAERQGVEQVIGRLGIAMQTCVACHQTFQLNEIFPARARQGTAERAAMAGEAGTAAADGRIPLLARPNERAYLLRSMRQYLAGLQTLLVALSQGDWVTVADTTRAMGAIKVHDISLFSAFKQDAAFREQALAVHRDFDAIARAASARRTSETLSQVGETMNKCVACHRTYRLDDPAGSRPQTPGR